MLFLLAAGMALLAPAARLGGVVARGAAIPRHGRHALAPRMGDDSDMGNTFFTTFDANADNDMDIEGLLADDLVGDELKRIFNVDGDASEFKKDELDELVLMFRLRKELGEADYGKIFDDPKRLAAGRLNEGLYEIMLETDNAAVVVDNEERIVAVNEKWQSLCGYSPSEALSKSPKILQGALTNTDKAASFAEQLRATGEAKTTLANYTKEGEPFVHRLHATKFTDNRTGEVFYITEGVEVTDKAVRSSILKRPSSSATAVHDLFAGLCLVGLLGVTLALAGAAAHFALGGTPIKPFASAAGVLLFSVCAPMLLDLPGRVFLLSSTLAAVGVLLMTLPHTLLLPSAIPLAIVILSAALVASEPQLPSREELHSPRGLGSGRRPRRSDLFARPSSDVSELEKERAARSAAWLEKGRLRVSGASPKSPGSPSSPSFTAPLPSPTSTSELNFSTPRTRQEHEHATPRCKQPKLQRAPLLSFSLTMMLLGVVSVMCQSGSAAVALPSKPAREAMREVAAAEALASDRKTDWIRESLTHSMLL